MKAAFVVKVEVVPSKRNESQVTTAALHSAKLMMSNARAIHLGGGNFYDDIRIDIAASHRRLDEGADERQSGPAPGVSTRLAGRLRYLGDALLQRANALEALSITGIRRGWFRDFQDYWANCLGGRPIQPVDFYLLYHEYRKKQQLPDRLAWGSAQQHIQNWQNPVHLFAVFCYARLQAVSPVVPMHVWRFIPRAGHCLEYGCSLAPFYYAAKTYRLLPEGKWALADIPGFAFHYAKYRYRRDPVDFLTIRDFSDPLAGKGPFDTVFLTTVLEHVDDPVHLMGYLFGKMKRGGILVFDYIKSDGSGLDTPSSLEKREECLKLIARETKLLSGAYATNGHQPITVVRLGD